MELHIHFCFHPQFLWTTRLLTFTGCGRLLQPVRLPLTGHSISCRTTLVRLSKNPSSNINKMNKTRKRAGQSSPLGVLWTGVLSLFHLVLECLASSSLSEEWEEAQELLCSSTESSLSESESENNRKLLFRSYDTS